MQPILILGIIVFAGFLFGELVKTIKLPKVTGYLLAGILLNPHISNIIPKHFMAHTDFVTNVSLSFITFSVGGTLLYSRIRKLGKTILSITFFEAETAFLLVIIGLASITPILFHTSSGMWLTFIIPLSILTASLASPTDPTATLAVIHEYDAKGEVSSTIMGVAAFDDALGIINYSIAISFAQMMTLHRAMDISSTIFEPLFVIGGAILLGIAVGIVFDWFTKITKREKESAIIVLLVSFLSLCFGIAHFLGVDELMATMTMGTVVVNFNPQREKIFNMLQRYTEELIFVMFFTVSGMHLNFSTLSHYYLIVIFFIIFRALGKIGGTMFGAHISGASKKVKKYTAGGLIPQGGIVIGLALMMRQNPAFDSISDIIISIIIGATVIHEIIGPISSKLSLKMAGEIDKNE